MTALRSWTIDGVDDHARERAREVARRSGLSLGAWLNAVIADTAAQAAAGMAEPAWRERGRGRPYRERDEAARRGRGPRHQPRAWPTHDDDDLSAIFEALNDLAERVGTAENHARSAVALAEDRLGRAAREHGQRPSSLSEVDQTLEEAQADLFAAEDEAHRTMRKLAGRMRALDKRSSGDPRFAAIASAVAELESRLDTMSQRIETAQVPPKPSRDEEVLAAIRARLDALSERVETPAPDGRIEATLHTLEARLGDIAERINRPAPPPPPPQPDPAHDERLQRIEEQISGLASVLTRPKEPGQPAPPQRSPRSAGFDDQRAWERDAATGGSDLAEAIRQIGERQKTLEARFEPGAYTKAIDERLQSLSNEITRRIDDSARERSIETLNDQIKALSGKLEASRQMTVESSEVANLQRQLLALHRTIENAVSKTSLAAVVAEVRELGTKLDQAKRSGVGRDALDRVEKELTEIRTAVEQAAPREAFGIVEQKIAMLARNLEARHPVDGETFRRLVEQVRDMKTALAELMPTEALREAVAEIRKLDQKIDSLKFDTDVAAIDALRQEIAGLRHQMREPADAKALSGIESEMKALARRLDSERPGVPSQAIDELKARLDRLHSALADQGTAPAIAALDERIRDLAERVERAPPLTERLAADLRAQLGDVARQAIPASDASLLAIERQFNALTAKLEAAHGRDLDSPQLQTLEAQIGHLAEAVEAARHAADEAARAALAPKPEPDAVGDHMVQALQQNLTELRQLTDASDRRTADALATVHDTLRKVVDRLAAMEAEPPRAAPTPAKAADMPGAALPRMPEPPPPGRPAERASKAAPPPKDGKSAVAAAREAAARAAQLKAAPQDRITSDLPLEPGSGRPGPLSAADAVRAAREAMKEKAPQGDGTTDVRRSFIAAARRAASIAASDVKSRLAEDDVAEAKMDAPPLDTAAAKSNPVVSRLLAGLKSKRKPIVMAIAAIVIVLGALHIVSSMRRGQEEAQPAPVAQIEVPAPRQAEPAPSEPQELTAPQQTQPGTFNPRTGPPPQSGTFSASPPATPTVAEAPAPAPVATPQPAPAALDLPPIPDQITSVRLRSAAQAGEPRALFEIGVRLTEGRGMPRDLAAASLWYKLAGDRGFAPALYRYANMLEKGQGVAKDIKEAMRLYQRAADLGSRKATHNLAVLFASGAVDGKAELDKAFPLFLSAAEQGLVDSQYNLAVLYASGQGTKQNLIEAYKWFAIAAQNGDREAAKKRDETGARLDGQALVNARLAAQAFHPKTMDPVANDEQAPSGLWEDVLPGRSSQALPLPDLGIAVAASARR